MLSVALVNRAYLQLNANKFEDAEKNSLRALNLAEGIVPPHDPRSAKSHG
jgi:hypothetical protein